MICARSPRHRWAFGLWAAAATMRLSAVPLELTAPLTYQLQADGATMRISVAALINRGTTTSGNLQLQLWAFATPYDPSHGSVTGYRLANVNFSPLAAGASYTGISANAAYTAPASGVWNIALVAAEDTGGGYVGRTYFDFPDPLPVAGTLAVYGTTNVLGNQVPVTIKTLLVDPSHAYWSIVDAGRIDSVGLTPGAQPGILATPGGGAFAMVQDSLYLYVLRSGGLGDGDVVRIAKTSGASTVIAAGQANTTGPRAIGVGSLGIPLTGGALYFAGYGPPDHDFYGSFLATAPTQGGAITYYGSTPPVDRNAIYANVSPDSFAADFTSIYWIEQWDRTIRHLPLVGGVISTVDVAGLGVNLGYLSAPTNGPAGGSLFWMEGNLPNHALKRRKPGGQVITVIPNVLSDNYAIDGDQVYLVSGVDGQANGQLCAVPIDGGAPRALLSILDTGGPGEIATDGNAIYWVSIDLTTFKNRIKKLVLPVTGTPLIDQQPLSQRVAPGSMVQFTALASGGGLSQIWSRNGVALTPATGAGERPATTGLQPRTANVVTSSASTSTLTLTNVTADDMGFYSCAITNSDGTTQTSVATLTVDTGGPSRLINVSTRGLVQAGAALTPGFVLRGSGSKQLLVRAVGPTLAAFGLDALADAKMDVINQQTSLSVANNDDWGGGASLTNTFSSLGAFPLPADSKDAASFTGLPVNQGGYTVRITAAGAATSGIALAEVYDADALTSPAKLVNVSTLGYAGVGANALTPGFVIGGTAPKRLLIRAIGPGLAPFGVGGTLADPSLAVIPLGLSLTVAGNDDWGGTADLKAAFASAGAFSVPDNTKDAAVVVTLPPGGYSVVVAGANNTTGNVLVEVYDLDP